MQPRSRHVRPRALLALALSLLMSASCRPAERASPKLQLDLYLMASCPFAQDMLRGLLPTLAGLEPHVALSVHYIGKVGPQGELSSMYGPKEVASALRAVCALELGGTSAWRKLTSCELAKKSAADCQADTGIAAGSFAACLSDGTGARLLARSFESSETAQVSESPTLHVAGKRYDSGRTARVLAHRLCAQPATEHTPYCVGLPGPVAAHVTLIGDRRCPKTRCDDTAFRNFAQKNLIDARLDTLDFSDARARALLARAGVTTLPVAVFDASLESDSELYEKLRPHLKTLPDGGGYLLTLGSQWDPT